VARRNVIVFGSALMACCLAAWAQTGPVYRTHTLLDSGFSSPACVKMLKSGEMFGRECGLPDAWLVWGSSDRLRYGTGPVHVSLYGRSESTGRWSAYLHDDGAGSGVEWSWLAIAARQLGGAGSVPRVTVDEDVRFYYDVRPMVRRGSEPGAVARVAALIYVQAGPGADSVRGHKQVELEVDLDSDWGDAYPGDPTVVFVGTSGPYLYAVADATGMMGVSSRHFDRTQTVFSLPMLWILRDISSRYADILPEPTTGWGSWVVEGAGVAVEARYDGFAGATVRDIEMGSHDVSMCPAGGE